jgi:hypothetical protein
MAERITVKQASSLTGLSELAIRIGLIDGTLPVGVAIKTSKKRTVYHISPAKLADYLGMTVDQVKGGTSSE